MASTTARRRQRSTRVVVAVGLLAQAAVVVAASFATGSLVLRGLAAVTGLVLGAAATRITHSELVQTRRDWASDRAEQARAYQVLDQRRTSEHLAYVEETAAEARRREEALREVESALVRAERKAAEATRKFSAEARRAELAEDESLRLGRQLEESEQRAAEAIVHLAELEQEADVLRAELAAWQSLRAEQARQHA